MRKFIAMLMVAAFGAVAVNAIAADAGADKAKAAAKKGDEKAKK